MTSKANTTRWSHPFPLPQPSWSSSFLLLSQNLMCIQKHLLIATYASLIRTHTTFTVLEVTKDGLLYASENIDCWSDASTSHLVIYSSTILFFLVTFLSAWSWNRAELVLEIQQHCRAAFKASQELRICLSRALYILWYFFLISSLLGYSFSHVPFCSLRSSVAVQSN